MERELLERIAHNTEPKESFQIVVSDNTTKFTTRFNPHIQLKTDKQYEIALVNLETYYSFPNVNTTNNHFSYSPDGDKWRLRFSSFSDVVRLINCYIIIIIIIIFLYQKAATILRI